MYDKIVARKRTGDTNLKLLIVQDDSAPTGNGGL